MSFSGNVQPLEILLVFSGGWLQVTNQPRFQL